MSVLKIAILYASVGTGHRSAAEALRDWAAIEHPQAEVFCKDVLEYTPSWMAKIVGGSYVWMARKLPKAWGWLYDATDQPKRRKGFWHALHDTITRFYLKKLLKDLQAFGPAMILCTHFFGTGPLIDALEGQTPVFYVNTDFLSHAFQRNPAFSGWFVGSHEALRQHRADGLTIEIYDTGIPIAPAFASSMTEKTKKEAREALGIENDKRVVLISGGGIGAGSLEKVADSLMDYPDWHTIVICGSNDSLTKRMESKYYPFPHIHVTGFVENIRNYYAASDLIILKPGGLSLAEVLTMKKPLLLLDPVLGQEQLNSDFLLDHGAARVLFDLRKTGERVDEILDDREGLRSLKKQCEKLARPEAASEILQIAIRETEKRKDRLLTVAGEKSETDEKDEKDAPPPPALFSEEETPPQAQTRTEEPVDCA